MQNALYTPFLMHRTNLTRPLTLLPHALNLLQPLLRIRDKLLRMPLTQIDRRKTPRQFHRMEFRA